MPSVFGDSEPAARRLELVHEVFSAATGPFLREQVGAAPDLAIDLGCGPGVCTRFLAEVTGAQHAAGLDASPRFIELARRFRSNQLQFFVHDVTITPFPVGPPELLYCRLLLTHLNNPGSVVAGWATELRPGARLLIEEVESIETRHPVFRQYLDLVAGLLAHDKHELYVGPLLDGLTSLGGLRTAASSVRPLRVENSRAAAMFSLNLPSWKHHPFVRSQYSDGAIRDLEIELQRIASQPTDRCDTEWGMRQLALEREG